MAVKGKKRRLGFWGEYRAAKYLRSRGYRIVARNFRCPFGEVDIIASKGDIMAFIEVKTRSDDAFGLPNESVRRDRRQRYLNCAKFYFSGKDIDCVVRFDVIEIFKGEINHIANAFQA